MASENESERDIAAEQTEEIRHNPFPVVAIGASAGGIEAFQQLLGNLPAETGMAFVLVQHLNPTYESHLSEVLSRSTAMPVLEATHNLPLQPNHVYIIPPNCNLGIEQGHLQLTPRGDPHPAHRSLRDRRRLTRSRAEGARHWCCAFGHRDGRYAGIGGDQGGRPHRVRSG